MVYAAYSALAMRLTKTYLNDVCNLTLLVHHPLLSSIAIPKLTHTCVYNARSEVRFLSINMHQVDLTLEQITDKWQVFSLVLYVHFEE